MQPNSDEVLRVVKQALGDQYSVTKLKNNQIWANEGSGAFDSRSFEGTPSQNAFNRIMKKISLEDGNEFNPIYKDIGKGTEINAVIDFAVDNNMIHSNIGNFLNARAGGRDSTKQSESPNDKLKRTLKERFWGIDSLTGASIADRVTDVGHIRAGANYKDRVHHYDNTREEVASDNRAYHNLEGEQLIDRNNKMLKESQAQGVDIDEMEADITAQMAIDALPKDQQAKGMVALGMATPEQVGLRRKAKNKAQKRLKKQ